MAHYSYLPIDVSFDLRTQGICSWDAKLVVEDGVAVCRCSEK